VQLCHVINLNSLLIQTSKRQRGNSLNDDKFGHPANVNHTARRRR